MLIFNGILYGILLFLFFIYQKRKSNWKKQLVFEEQLEGYLSAVMAAYGKNQNMEEALWEVEDTIEIELDGGNTFVQMFRAMCEMVQAEGDVRKEGTSVFLKNLQYLKEEIREHLLLYRERQYLFLGLDILSILPVFFVPAVELWAIGASDTLAEYYHGNYGLLTTVLLFVSTILIYLLILWLLLPQIETEKQYEIEHHLLQRTQVAALVDWYINRHYSVCLKKNEVIKEMQGYGNIREFLVKKILFGISGCGLCLLMILCFKFSWYSVMVVFCGGILATQVPELFLIITKWKSKDRRMEECLRMQMVVLFLIHYSNATVEELLCKMEEFAKVFHLALAKAVDSFSYQRMQTIETLKEDIVDEPMKRISEALLVCDELPIEQAFMNLEGEREYFLKKNMEERRHNQKEYAAVGKLLAYVPLMLLILLKMVVPFVAEGLGELAIYSQEMMGFM